MFKKFIAAFMIIALLPIMAACGGSGSNSNSETASKLKNDYGLSSGFRSDAQKSWLVVSTSNAAANDVTAWALDYYKEYGADADVIWVVNFSNNTTTSIRNDSQDGLLLHVMQMDGAKDVESSLNEGNVYSGAVLSEFYIYEEDGSVKIEDLATED